MTMSHSQLELLDVARRGKLQDKQLSVPKQRQRRSNRRLEGSVGCRFSFKIFMYLASTSAKMCHDVPCKSRQQMKGF